MKEESRLFGDDIVLAAEVDRIALAYSGGAPGSTTPLPVMVVVSRGLPV